MNIFLRARSRRFLLLLAACALTPGASQARAAEGKAGPFRFSAGIATTPGGIESGSLRLEGNVRLYTPDPKASPQVDLSAPLVTADSAAKPQRVRGQGGVSFRYKGVRPATRPGEPGVPVAVEAEAREVLLDIAGSDGRRRLTLKGDLSGFYQIGPDRTELSGQSAVISFGKKPDDVKATFEGGAQGFTLGLPPQTLGPLALGKVSLHGGRVTYDTGGNASSLEGGARLSSEGPASLQISAAALDAAFVTKTEMIGGKEVITRSLRSLSSQGRVSLSLALPPQDIGTPAGAEDATYPLSASSAVLRLVPQKPSATPGKPAQAQPNARGNARGSKPDEPQKPKTTLAPVSIELAADSAVIEPYTPPGTQEQLFTLRLSGNVRGSYVLREVLSASRPARPASIPTRPAAGATGGASGDGEELRPPLSLDLEIRGVQIELPATFGFEL